MEKSGPLQVRASLLLVLLSLLMISSADVINIPLNQYPSITYTTQNPTYLALPPTSYTYNPIIPTYLTSSPYPNSPIFNAPQTSSSDLNQISQQTTYYSPLIQITNNPNNAYYPHVVTLIQIATGQMPSSIQNQPAGNLQSNQLHNNQQINPVPVATNSANSVLYGRVVPASTPLISPLSSQLPQLPPINFPSGVSPPAQNPVFANTFSNLQNQIKTKTSNSSTKSQNNTVMTPEQALALQSQFANLQRGMSQQNNQAIGSMGTNFNQQVNQLYQDNSLMKASNGNQNLGGNTYSSLQNALTASFNQAFKQN